MTKNYDKALRRARLLGELREGGYDKYKVKYQESTIKELKDSFNKRVRS